MKIPPWIAAVLLALLFAAGLYRLVAARMDEGDAYPPYSTFRADPLGSKAFFAALQQISGHPLAVERHFRPLERLWREPGGQENDLRQTLVVLLGEEPRLWSWNPPKDRVEAIEHAARAGATVLIAFAPIDSVPRIPALANADQENHDAPAPPRPHEKEGLPAPTPTPATDDGNAEKNFFDEMKKNFARRDIRLGERWGLDVRREKGSDKPKGPDKDSPRERFDLPAYPAFPLETGKDPLAWHSALDFEISPSEQPTWRVMYSRSRRPVLAVRDFGAGRLILASDAYFLSNEALFKESNPEALAWLLGDARRVIFDEQMHGTREDPGLMTFVHRYRLTGAFLALILLALLYVWKNAAPLIAPPPDPGAEGSPPQEGLAAEAGLPSLLRRAVPPAQLPRLCFEQWRGSAGGLDGRVRPTPERAAQLAQILAAPDAEKNPAATYRAMRAALRQDRPHPN